MGRKKKLYGGMTKVYEPSKWNQACGYVAEIEVQRADGEKTYVKFDKDELGSIIKEYIKLYKLCVQDEGDDEVIIFRKDIMKTSLYS